MLSEIFLQLGITKYDAKSVADDVYANGNNTQLDVPRFDEMTLGGLTGVADWFEDYNTNDTSYSEGLNNGGDTGRRYKDIPAKESTNKHNAPIIESDVAEGKTEYANKLNAYVCITLGIE